MSADVADQLTRLVEEKKRAALSRKGTQPETAPRVLCAQCGSRFKPTVTQLRRAARTDRVRETSVNGELYCSRDCWRTAASTTKPCEHCGQPFTVKRHDGRVRRFCSQACGAADKDRKQEVPCAVCGTPVVRTRHTLAKHTPTCSPEHAGIVAAQKRLGRFS